MRTLFFGTPDIAVPALEALNEISTVAGVICQPDRPAGRGLQLRAPAVKQKAQQLGLEVLQPRKIRTAEFASWVRSRQAEVALVIAYGRILPPALLEAPAKGCMNLHASLLPRYRGAAPINWAIARGETETGICLMQMDEGCDTGPVFCQRTIAIGPDETAGELYGRLAALAAEVVRDQLEAALSGELVAAAQDHEAATLAPLLSKQDGAVDWSVSAQQVHDHVRGMTPWPGAHTTLDTKRFKLLETRLEQPEGVLAEPGTVFAVDDAGAHIACGSGSVVLQRGQVAGKKALSAKQLAAGRSIGLATRFGIGPDDC